MTPASPSTADTLPVTLKNIGNGTDTMSVAVTAASGLTITGYVYNGTSYGTVAALNTALGAAGIPAGSNVVVKIVYNVAAGQGGATLPITLTQTSKRSPSTQDATTTNVQPPVTSALGVTPKSGTPIDRLPSNGTQYTQTYVVSNNGNASDTYALAGAAGTNLTIVSVNGAAGASSSVTVGANATQNVNVVYTVNAGSPAGALDSLKLTATSGANNTLSDVGYVVVHTVRAAITITKQAYRDDKTTAINATTDRVLPGDYIQYKITVSNASGAAAAQTVHVSDALPAAVTYDSNAPDAAGWTLSQASGTVVGDLATLAAGASRYFWIRVRVR